MKEKTDYLESYLENAHEDLNRKYESLAPTSSNTNIVKYKSYI